MYPVRLCLHILPDVLRHGYGRFLVGPRRVVFEDVRFFIALIPRTPLERKPRKGEAPAFFIAVFSKNFPFAVLKWKKSSFFRNKRKKNANQDSR